MSDSTVSLFNSNVPEDVINTVKQTMTVSRNESGSVNVSFATNRGKGTGAQQLLVSEFEDYVSTLEEIAEYGIEEIPEADLSPSEMVRDTIRNTVGVVSFRVRGGKGAKPAKIPAGQFDEFVELLRSTVDLVGQAAEGLSEPEEVE